MILVKEQRKMRSSANVPQRRRLPRGDSCTSLTEEFVRERDESLARYAVSKTGDEIMEDRNLLSLWKKKVILLKVSLPVE